MPDPKKMAHVITPYTTHQQSTYPSLFQSHTFHHNHTTTSQHFLPRSMRVPTCHAQTHVSCSMFHFPVRNFSEKNCSLPACTSSARQLCECLKIRNTANKKVASSFYVQSHNANTESHFSPGPAARLGSAQVGGKLMSIGISRAVSQSRHVRSATRSATVVGDTSSCRFASLDNLMG